MKKLKLKIANAEYDRTQDGVIIVTVTLQSAKGTYTRGIKLSDWENPRAKRSIEKLWLANIAEIEATKELSEDEIMGKLKKIKGEELAEDE